MINTSSPDILGVQEMKLPQLDYMDGRLPDYAFYGVSENTGTTSHAGQRAGIFYKHARFDLLDQGEFWLSDTPTIPGTTFFGGGGDTNNARMATWLKLYDRQLEQNYFVLNTHWSLDSNARVLSGILIRNKIIELSDGLPVIVTGDLNEKTSSGYTALVRRRNASEFQLSNGYFESGAPLGKTFHGYDGGVEGLPIDYVLPSTGDFQAISGSIVRTTFGGYYPSDHYPVEVTLEVIPRLTADADLDGDVDGADFLYLQRNNPELIPLWQMNYGMVSPPLAAVPEPATFHLLLLVTLTLCYAPRQRRAVICPCS